VQVIFGLGNPGLRYRLTRPNAGFILLDYIQDLYKIPFSPGKGDYYFCEVIINNRPVILVKPVTYMNLSGLAVNQVLEYFNIAISDLIVVYDDFHLPFGSLRFRARGSSAGHNGIESIVGALGTYEFSRLRIGIGSAFIDAIDFVLSPFDKDELRNLGILLKTAYAGLQTWAELGIQKAMNDYNGHFLDKDN